MTDIKLYWRFILIKKKTVETNFSRMRFLNLHKDFSKICFNLFWGYPGKLVNFLEK